MDFFIQQVVSGLAAGGTYALVALGFALIFGVSNILNIAHSQTIMLAPAFVVILVTKFGWPPVPSLIAAFVLTLAEALVIHFIGVHPFLRRTRYEYLAPLIATFGLSLVIEHVIGKIIGTVGQPFPVLLPRDAWQLGGGLILLPMQVLSLVASLVVMAGLAVLVGKTDVGREMRAVAESRVVAESLGISASRRTITVTLMAGSLGAFAGLLFAAGNNVVTPVMGLQQGLVGLVVLIIGGVTSLTGAVVAGLLLGVIEAMVNGFISSRLNEVLTFGLLIIILLVRPSGLFAMVSREDRA